jgi:hypothetical protein
VWATLRRKRIDVQSFARQISAMPSTRTPSLADLFVRGNKLRDLLEIVGMVLARPRRNRKTL